MDIRIIKSPSAGTMEILKHRISGAMEKPSCKLMQSA